MKPLKLEDHSENYIAWGVDREADIDSPESVRYACEVARRHVDLYESFVAPVGLVDLRSGQAEPGILEKIHLMRGQIEALGGDPEAGGYAQLPPAHLVSAEVAQRILVYLREELGRGLLQKQRGRSSGQKRRV
jgi:hypothetical protein